MCTEQEPVRKTEEGTFSSNSRPHARVLCGGRHSYQPSPAREYKPSLPNISPNDTQGLQLTKEQLNAASDGMSLRATVTAENSHQILLVNDPVASKIGNDWLNKIASKSGKPRPRL